MKNIDKFDIGVYNKSARRYYLCICCKTDNFGLSFGSGATVDGEYIPRHFLLVMK